MKKFKRLMALAAVSMLGIQLMGAGAAYAATTTSDCDFGSDNLEVTIDMDDVELWIDDEGVLYCDPSTKGGKDAATVDQPVSTIDSITVEMDADESEGQLFIYLDDDSTSKDAAEWPEFDTFDIDVTTPLNIDGTSVEDSAGNSLDIVFGKSTFSFSGTSGTYAAPSLVLDGGKDKDVIDASKATVKVTADGNGEDDLVKGGSANDKLDQSGTAGDDGDIVYGNAGNDVISGTVYQAWGGEGSDDLAGIVVAPGAGNDDVDADLMVTYADLTEGIEYELGDTGGAAGDDDLTGTFSRLYGSQGDDVLIFAGARLVGNGGDDVMKCGGCTGTGYAAGGAGDDYIAELGHIELEDTPDDDCTGTGEWCSGLDNVFYGNAGDDVLRGKGGEDELRGGPGKDQAWGGSQPDTCTAEVMNRCEYVKN